MSNSNPYWEERNGAQKIQYGTDFQTMPCDDFGASKVENEAMGQPCCAVDLGVQESQDVAMSGIMSDISGDQLLKSLELIVSG